MAKPEICEQTHAHSACEQQTPRIHIHTESRTRTHKNTHTHSSDAADLVIRTQSSF